MVNCILTSDIIPLGSDEGCMPIRDVVSKLFEHSTEVDIAVGYVSVGGLDELDDLVKKNNISRISLIIGMYDSADGIPQSVYLKIQQLEKEWSEKRIGEIRLVKGMPYHGKVFVFWDRCDSKTGNLRPFKAVVGSANLSVLDSSPAQRLFEVATTLDEQEAIGRLVEHIGNLKQKCTVPAKELCKFKIAHERIPVLSGIEGVIEITDKQVEYYQSHTSRVQFKIPIKAPTYERRNSTSRRDFVRSNINVCYGRGRKMPNGRRQPRNWYEVQITVDTSITSQPGYPKDMPFWIVTDDNYKFEAHTTADNNKQLTAYGREGNDRVFGRWIKGRLATAGYVKPVDNVQDDKAHNGVITDEMLSDAGMNFLILAKTGIQETGVVFKTRVGNNNNVILDKKHSYYQQLDVWSVSFEGRTK